MERRPTLNPLTSLRFFAAGAVWLHHTRGMLPESGWLERLPLGNGAVSFFFVLSGFVLHYAYREVRISPGELRSFYWRRWTRIWPLHLLGLILALVAIVQHGPWSRMQDVLLDAGIPYGIWGALTAKLLLVQSWLGTQAIAFGINGPSWSISTEFGFYLLFPFLAWRLRKTWHWKILAVAGSVAFVYLLAHYAGVPDGRGRVPWSAPGNTITTLTQMCPLVRVVEFYAGILASLAFGNIVAKWRPGIAWGTVLEVVALCSLAFGAWYFSTIQRAVPGGYFVNCLFRWMGLLPVFLVMIPVFAFGSGWISRVLSLKTLVLLGEASYALYLLHIPLRLILARYFGISQNYDSEVGLWPVALYAVICVAASIVTYKFYEMPVRRLLLALGKRVKGVVLVRAVAPPDNP